MPVSEANEPKALGCAIFLPHNRDTHKCSERVKKFPKVLLIKRLAFLGSGKVFDIEISQTSGLLGAVPVNLSDKLFD
jgi:hypothetical protein